MQKWSLEALLFALQYFLHLVDSVHEIRGHLQNSNSKNRDGLITPCLLIIKAHQSKKPNRFLLIYCFDPTISTNEIILNLINWYCYYCTMIF